MIRVLFVCHGNICRSPMAEFIMKDMVRKRGLAEGFVIDSAATSREEIGNPVYPPARRKLGEHGIACDGHHARQMTRADYDRYDSIVCMDRANIRNATRIAGGDPAGKITLLLDHTRRAGQDVADPWYTGDFDATWRDVTEGCEALLAEYTGAREETDGLPIYEYGCSSARNVLIQMVDDHDLSVIESEVAMLQALSGEDFCLKAVKVRGWNDDLSPWEAPAVFGKEGFGGGAGDTLSQILPLTEDRTKSYYIGGYSLAGLFALWAASQTDRFQGVAAASPSVWFPGIVEHLREHPVQTEAVCLSLGDKEEKTRNKVMARVGDSIREIHQILQEQGIRSTLEWNPGNHFRDPDRRTAKAFAWVLPAQGGKGKY